MEQYRKQRLNLIIKIILYIAIFYNSGSFISTCDTTIGVLLMLLALFLLIGIYKVINRKFFYIIFILIIMFFFNIIFTNSYIYLNRYIRLLLIISLAIAYSTKISFKQFVLDYNYIIANITLITIIVYVIINIFGKVNWLHFLPISTNVNNVSAYNGGLFIVYTYSYRRLSAFFWEPAVYSTYALLALLYELYFFKRPRVKNLIIFILGILISQSTGGIILLAYVLSFYFIIKGKKIITKIFWIIILCIGVGIVYINYYTVLDYLIEKFPIIFSKLDVNLQKDTLVDRSSSALLNLTIFYDNIFFGVGLSNVEILYKKLGGGAETSTNTYFIAAFGLWGIFYSLFYMGSILQQKKLNFLTKIFFIFLITLILEKEPYGFQVIIYIMFMYFFRENLELNSIEQKNIKRRKNVTFL